MKKSVFNIYRSIKKSRVEDYYLKQLYKGQAAYTRWFNFFIYRILVLGGSFFTFLVFTGGNKVLISLFAGISVLGCYHFLAKRVEKIRLAQVIQKENAKLANEEFVKSLKAMDKESFVSFIFAVLAKLGDFTELTKTDYLESEGINFICKYQGELTLVQCHLLDGEDTVGSRYVRELSRAMSKRKYIRGLIISTTDFRDDARIFCDLIKDKRNIILWDCKELIRISREAGKYPQDADIKDLILKRMEHQERNWQDAQRRILGKTRITPYFIYAAVLVGASNFIHTGLKYIYYGGAAVLFALGTLGLITSLRSRGIFDLNK
ncbi:MAG: restriction endonuclease [Peptococcaceae bacterium]